MKVLQQSEQLLKRNEMHAQFWIKVLQQSEQLLKRNEMHEK